MVKPRDKAGNAEKEEEEEVVDEVVTKTTSNRGHTDHGKPGKVMEFDIEMSRPGQVM